MGNVKISALLSFQGTCVTWVEIHQTIPSLQDDDLMSLCGHMTLIPKLSL